MPSDERVGVVEADAGPQVGAAGGDARRVLEAAGRQPHQLAALARVRGRKLDERRRGDVRNVADDRHGLVVRLGIDRDDARAERRRPARASREKASGIGVVPWA